MTSISNSLAEMDRASLIHPQTNLRAHLAKGPQIIAKTSGSMIVDAEGRDYIECLGGLWCCSLGFRQERLARAAFEQMSTLGYYHIYKHHSHEPVIRLADKLLSTAPVGMSKVQFQNSGSEANETALKLVWYYHNAIDRPAKKKVITRLGGFHGHTIGAASLSGKPDTQGGYDLPCSDRFLYTLCPHYYRSHEEGESEEAYSQRLADSLEQMILDNDPDTIGGFFAEPVMGASGGLIPPKGYFEKVQQVLRKYEILFVADEVITGMGRTGQWWASQTLGLEPDIITSAKALSAGMVPMGAAMMNQKVFDAATEMSDRLGVYAHGSTFSGHPVAAAVALETIAIIEEQGLIAHGAAIGSFIRDQLADLNEHPLIDDLRQLGGIVSMELVADKKARKNFAPSANINGVLTRHCQKEGVLPRLGGDRVVFAPPLTMTFDEAALAVDRFKRAIDATWAEVAEGA